MGHRIPLSRKRRPYQRGANALNAWCEANDTSTADLAAEFEITTHAVNLWRAGRKRPGFDAAIALERYTDGAVEVHLWARE
jgi:hypothetical protein